MKIKNILLTTLAAATFGGVAVTLPTDTASAAKLTAMTSFPKNFRGTWYNKEDGTRTKITTKKWTDYDPGTTSVFKLHKISRKKGTDSWLYGFKTSNNNIYYSFWPEGKKPKLSAFNEIKFHEKIITKTYHGKKIKVLKEYGERNTFATFAYKTKQQSKHLKAYEYYGN
ncbi:hypothetical protein [Levilactobacillus tongjiangensis]|uniref:DUF4767 domain-containing protein n=1 Tax=Levilactobacillus tongjiangensis TaxID=2486023 RepID=A0ABW1SRY5_9LACO|nr:hypothetical protein [Levilactobacillus tongjiangensis]